MMTNKKLYAAIVENAERINNDQVNQINEELIWNISQELKKDKKLNEKLNVIFLEDYNVSLSEILMPAANISEQISLAGT